MAFLASSVKYLRNTYYQFIQILLRNDYRLPAEEWTIEEQELNQGDW